MNSESLILNFESLGLISATQVSCFESNVSKRKVWFALTLQCRPRRSAELSDLPENAQKYVGFLEKISGAPMSAIGVGPGRDQTIVVKEFV